MARSNSGSSDIGSSGGGILSVHMMVHVVAKMISKVIPLGIVLNDVHTLIYLI